MSFDGQTLLEGSSILRNLRMASKKFISSAEYTLSCPVCRTFYVDPNIPKDLDCPHTCCQVCLKYMVSQAPGQPITCPMRCEQKTTVPAGGVDALKTNLHLKNLAEEHPGCVSGEQPKVGKCTPHREKMHLYCMPCNTVGCQNCCLLDHQGPGHVIKDIKETTKLQKKELHDMLTKVKDDQKTCEERMKELEELEKNTLASMQSERDDIDKCVQAKIQNTTQLVQNRGETLKNEVNEVGGACLAKIDAERKSLQMRAAGLEDARHVAQQKRKSPNYAYVTQHAGIMANAKKLKLKEQWTFVKQNQYPVKFVNLKNALNLGRIVKVRQVELLQTFGEFECAREIASSPDGLLAVVDFDGNSVVIYQEQNGQYSKKFSLDLKASTWKPTDILIQPDGKFCVARHDGIEVYSSTGTYYETVVLPATSSGNVYPYSLTALKNGRIMVGPTEGDVVQLNQDKCCVQALPRVEALPRVQALPTNSPIKACHLASIQNDGIAVSDHTQGKVRILRFTPDHRGYVEMPIPQVQGICYDEATHSLLIARSMPTEEGITNTGVIEQYCSITYKFVACLADKLFCPNGITLTTNGRLAVADKTTVKIFRVTY